MAADTEARDGDLVPSVRVFGGVGVDAADGPAPIGGARQRRLLALLVVRHGRVVTNEWLAEYLWSDDERPDASATRLRTYLSRLRHSLPDGAQRWIETESGGYRLDAPPDAIEHLRFARLRGRAREARDAGDPLAARQLLDEALSLWRGEPFRELDDLDWARADIEQLHLDRLEMLEERWETELALGRHTQISGELGSFVGEQPLRERAARQYATALHRSGRTPEALRVISTFRRRLTDETGLDPSPALVELEHSLLVGDPALALPAGRPLRGYRLLEEVGAGAFAVVWRATQPSVDRDVAIKQIRSEFARRPEFIRRFEAEARLVAHIEHPHIVPLIDFWRDPDSAYLVMRWLGGDTLQRRLDDGPLSVDETVTLAEQIGGALAAAHAHGVVHRDVKPSNIIFDAVGHAYLTDFGIALSGTDPDGPEAALSPGSPAYASPEQLRGDEVGPAADIFSLGVVLHECLVGSPPLRATGTHAPLDLRHEPFSLLRERADAIPPAISAAIARAIAPDPADRLASIAELVRALHGTPDDTGSPRDQPRVGRRENPYVGLRAFSDEDADRFFGRDRLIDEIVARLSGTGVRSRCVVVVGPSGSGKSSVVRAGVLPALRRGAVPGSGEWFTTTMVPGSGAYESLEAALLRIATGRTPSLLAELRNGERGILRGVRRITADAGDRVAVVIDQFEELFTTTDHEDADRFLTALSIAIEDPSSPLRLIATLRADFYDRPLLHPTFARIVKEAAVEVTPLAADELVEAITGPARHAGVEFQPGLVAQATAATVGQAAPLPLLQYALSEMFDRRSSPHVVTDADYETIGGVAGALTRRAEMLYAEFDEHERAAIRRIFGRLTNPNDSGIRLRIPVADLGDDQETGRVLERFDRARLLTFGRDDTTREPTVEVAHEALLREWPRAATWLAEDRELRHTAGAIGAAADLWDRGGRQASDLYRGGRLEAGLDLADANPEWLRSVDHTFLTASRTEAEAERRAERRRIRRLRRLVTGTAVALVAALVAGGLAFTQQRRADRAAGAAESAAEEAELATLITRSTAIAADRPVIALLLALEARQRSPGPVTDGAVLDALAAGGFGRQIGGMARLRAGDCGAGPPSRRISPDGLLEFGVDGDELLVKNLVTGETTTRGMAPEPCVSWFEDPATGRRWAGSLGGDRQWTGRADGPWVEAEVSGRTSLLGGYTVEPGDLSPGGSVHAKAVDGRLLYWHGLPRDGAYSPTVGVVDHETLEPVGEAVADFTIDLEDPASHRATAATETGGLFAVAGKSTDASDAGADSPMVVILDAATGAEVLRIRHTAPVNAVAFDREARFVVAGGDDGMVVVIDLASQDVVERVSMSDSDPVIAVGTSPEGDIIAVGRRSIETFDRRGNPLGLPVPVSSSETARIRPDGTVIVVPVADTETIQVIDPTGGPLVEQGWRVDPSALVGFGARQAAVVSTSHGIEMVDLGTGVRTSVVPKLPGGGLLDAVAVAPEDGGYLAWDRTGSIGRWRDGAVTEWLELWSGAGDVDLSRDSTSPGGRASEARVGTGAAAVFLRGLAQEVHRLDPTPGTLELVTTINSPPSATVGAAPAADGGLHLLLDDGVVRTYDRTGQVIAQIASGLLDPGFIVADPETDAIAVGGERGAVFVDPATDTVERVEGVGAVVSLAFARAGTQLVVVESNGTVRLWDTDRAQLFGILWNGGGTASPSPPWYDASTDSIWVATSGTILRFSLDPARWIEHICNLAGRELTNDEWKRLVPGDGPHRPACR